MNTYLKRVVWHIEDLFVALPKTNVTVISENLQRLRAAIDGMQKYQYRDGVYKNFIRDGMVINEPLDNYDFVQEDFERLGTYYILYNGYKHIFKKGDLIDQSTAIKNNLIGTSYSGGSWELIKQKNTDELYLVDLNFFDEYAFLIDGEFNRRSKSLADTN